VPEEAGWGVFDLFGPPFDDDANPWLRTALPLLYLAGTSVVEPLLVAGGFGLYLNRRIYLEGWDVDLAFRRLARRAAPLASAAALTVALLGAAPTPAAAQACVADDPTSASACLGEVLADPAFGASREVEWWRLREDLFDLDGDADLSLPALGWLGELLATFGELLLWALFAAAAIALLLGVAARRAPARPAGASEPAPTRLFGLDLDPDSLPDDVVGAARAAWARGERREALSLLYRGALVALVERGGLAIPRSATELECVELVRGSARAADAPAFRSLTLAWLHARYAGAPPGDDAFDALCGAFEAAFGASLAADGPDPAPEPAS
jgi:hypothetical protein